MWTIDHVVLGAAELGPASEALAARLGAAPAGGGAHPAMGTHNALWSLGPLYLELIAIDPAAPPPGRPRWFGLDAPGIRARLAEGPAPLGWVLRVTDPAAARAAWPGVPGPWEEHRRGALRWTLTVPGTGAAPHGGTVPLLIRWPEGTRRPDETLPDAGLRLARLDLALPDPACLPAPLPPPVTVREGPAALRLAIRRPDGTEVSFA